ncbi:MAG: helix-turn-helix transcriptional regulator [Chloroflexota bacterium]
MRDLRRALGWTQRELGLRVGMSQSTVSRLERGIATELSIGGADRLLKAMGARLGISVTAPYLADRARQRDPVHARLAAFVVAHLCAAGWIVATEVEVGGDRSRGWIDILAWHPGTGLLLVIELKTEIHDVGAIQRSLNWYEREAWAAAKRLGWYPRSVHASLLLLATEANDQRVADNGSAFRSKFPVRARELAEVIRSGTPPPVRGRSVAMVDPLSRRAMWVRPLRIDGRSGVAPYRDYADFMRVTHTRGRVRCRDRGREVT